MYFVTIRLFTSGFSMWKHLSCVVCDKRNRSIVHCEEAIWYSISRVQLERRARFAPSPILSSLLRVERLQSEAVKNRAESSWIGSVWPSCYCSASDGSGVSVVWFFASVGSAVPRALTHESEPLSKARGSTATATADHRVAAPCCSIDSINRRRSASGMRGVSDIRWGLPVARRAVLLLFATRRRWPICGSLLWTGATADDNAHVEPAIWR